ncbi:MAG: site-specific integrase [Candidatus Auribacterota bacterium]|nr:site-specific integrase [Candidatus Auribacterota bacterium]
MSTPLRTLMLNQMTLRYLAERTKTSYLKAVTGLAEFYMQSPDTLTEDQVQRYLLYMIEERKLAWSTCNVAFSAFRFLYTAVLKRPDGAFSLPPRRKQKKLPYPLTVEETLRLITLTRNPKHRALLMTVYSAGLRVSEVVKLKPFHIESSRRLIRVDQGKGNKDRYTHLSPRLIQELRSYWRLCHPTIWLFPGRDKNRPMAIGTAQQIYYQAKERAGITRPGGIHTLRHCFATHQLESGCDIFVIKNMLGHSALASTTRYLHISPERLRSVVSPLDDLMRS